MHHVSYNNSAAHFLKRIYWYQQLVSAVCRVRCYCMDYIFLENLLIKYPKIDYHAYDTISLTVAWSDVLPIPYLCFHVPPDVTSVPRDALLACKCHIWITGIAENMSSV